MSLTRPPRSDHSEALLFLRRRHAQRPSGAAAASAEWCRHAAAIAISLVACVHVPGDAQRSGGRTATEAKSETSAGEQEAVRAIEDSAPRFVAQSDAYVFVSSRTGVPQLFRASWRRPQDPPVQLTSGAEGLPAFYGERPRVAAGGTQVVFHCGAFEWCRLDMRGGGPGERRKGPTGTLYQFGPLTSRASPGVFYFEGRQKDSPGLHLYAGDFDGPSDVRLVYEDPTINGWLRDVAADGKHAAVIDMRSHDDWALVVVDLDARGARRLYPAARVRAKVSSVVFSADSKRVLVGTDEGGDHATVLALDIESGAELARYEEPTFPGAEVTWLALSELGDRLAVTLSAGSVDVVRVLEASSLRRVGPIDPAVPAGQGTAEAFTPDGAGMVVSWATPNESRAIYVVPLDGSVLEPLDRSRPPRARELLVDASVERVASFDGTLLPTNVYRPRTSSVVRHPVLVHLSSGPGSTAMLARTPLVDFFLREGFVVIEPNVRGAPGFGRSFQALDDGRRRVDSFRDIGAVARWAGAQEWADPRRMVVMGASYSGYQALMTLATEPALWRAGVDLYGITDWKTFYETTNRGTASVYAREVGSPITDGDFLEAISPLRLTASMRAPLFVYHGRNDGQVPIAQSEALVRRLSAQGVEVTTLFAEGEGHGMEAPATRREFFAKLRAFLRQTVR